MFNKRNLFKSVYLNLFLEINKLPLHCRPSAPGINFSWRHKVLNKCAFEYQICYFHPALQSRHLQIVVRPISVCSCNRSNRTVLVCLICMVAQYVLNGAQQLLWMWQSKTLTNTLDYGHSLGRRAATVSHWNRFHPILQHWTRRPCLSPVNVSGRGASRRSVDGHNFVVSKDERADEATGHDDRGVHIPNFSYS